MPAIISITPEGKVQKENIKKPPGHEQLHKIVDGYIELIPYFTKYDNQPCVAFCDEDGKRKGKPLNIPAQILWNHAMGRRITENYLVGTIAIIVGPQSFLNRL